MKRLSEKFTLDLKSDTISALTVVPEAFAFALGGVMFMVVIGTFAQRSFSVFRKIQISGAIDNLFHKYLKAEKKSNSSEPRK